MSASLHRATNQIARPPVGGRPKKSFTEDEWRIFDMFCKVGAQKVDIVDAMLRDEGTITRMVKARYGCGFAEYRQKMIGTGRALLASKQLEVALSGNVTMLIWLGKQWLGQSDTPSMTDTGKTTSVILTLASEPSPATTTSTAEATDRDE